MEVFAVIAVLALVWAIVISSWIKMNQKRQQELFAVARRLGLNFSPGFGPGTLRATGRYRDADVCNRGRSQRPSNAISGPLGVGTVCYFDYRFTTGYGKNKTTPRYSICAFESAYFMRRLFVRPEDFGDKVAGFLGSDDDIDLDNAEFNSAFFVKCEDKKFAYDVLSQRAMEFFMARRGLTMEMTGARVFFYRPGTLKPAEVERLIRDSAEFFALLPNYLLSDREVRHGRSVAPGRMSGGSATNPGGPPHPRVVPDRPAVRNRPMPPQ